MGLWWIWFTMEREVITAKNVFLPPSLSFSLVLVLFATVWRAFYFLWKSCKRRKNTSETSIHFRLSTAVQPKDVISLAGEEIFPYDPAQVPEDLAQATTGVACDRLVDWERQSLVVRAPRRHASKRSSTIAEDDVRIRPQTTCNRWKYELDDGFIVIASKNGRRCGGFAIIFTFSVTPVDSRITLSNENGHFCVACHILRSSMATSKYGWLINPIT